MKAVVFAYHDMGCTGTLALLEAGYDIAAIFTHPDVAGENNFFGSVARIAAERGIPVYAPDDVNHPLWVDRIQKLSPDVIFSFYYRNLICDDILNVAAKGAFNLHGSLLPAYRGRAPLNWVLVNGETETGVTLHRMVHRADAGAIVAQHKVAIDADETALQLHHKLCATAQTLLRDALPAIQNGSFSETAHTIVRVPEKLLHTWQEHLPGLVDPEEDRGQWEYLYKQEELADLPGNRYHKKRNHYNSYIKTYGEPDYHSLDDAMVEDVLAVQDDWCQWHECEQSPSLRAENEAINRVLSHWNCFTGLVGGSLYVDGKMVAFSVGENLDGESLGVHYEKGLNGFKGVYQTINCTFSRRAGEGFTYINRAQDLDEEGLRQAKMTYLPADFLRKYKVSIRKA